MRENEEFSQAGDVLKTLFKRLVPEEQAVYSHFFSGWEKIAGEETAMHVFPRDIVNNVLILETDHPVWSQQIRMRQEGLLKIIHRKYPALEIKKIRVVISNKKQEKKKVIKPIIKKELPIKNDINREKESESFFSLLDTMRKRGNP